MLCAVQAHESSGLQTLCGDAVQTCRPDLNAQLNPMQPMFRSAPEMLWGAKCTEKADIYSFGEAAEVVIR